MAIPAKLPVSQPRNHDVYDRLRLEGSMRDVVLLHPTDSVCVAARDLSAGTSVELPSGRLQLLDDVMQGHKIARTAIQSEEAILKWGQTIGFATCRIEPGRWVHSQNMATGALRQEYEKSTAVPVDPSPLTGYTFQGYRRADGRAGTRNYTAVISTVNCSAPWLSALRRGS